MSDKKNDFRSSFKAAKSSGKKTFSYKGKKYNTTTAEEKAVNLSPSKLTKKSNKSYESAKRAGFKSKSKNEISESYTREGQYRKGDKLEAKGLNPKKYSDRMKGDFKGSAFALKRPSRLIKNRKK